MAAAAAAAARQTFDSIKATLFSLPGGGYGKQRDISPYRGSGRRIPHPDRKTLATELRRGKEIGKQLRTRRWPERNLGLLFLGKARVRVW